MNQFVERTCWCGSAKAEPLGAFEVAGGRSFPWVRCAGCGVCAIEPQPDDDELLRYYSSEYYGSSREKFIGPIAVMVGLFQSRRAKAAARLVPRGGRILDVGCGNGGYLIQMKRLGFQVEGTEWTADSAARVPASENIPVHVGDLLDLNLPAQFYDMVSMWHVLEHVRQPREALNEIRRILKPQGTLVLSLPNAESRQARRFGEAWFHYDPPRHLFDFGINSLAKLLDMTGFQIESISTHSLEQNTFGFIQSWLNARGYPRDRLYGQLKGLSRQSFSTWLTDMTWLGVLLGPALLVSTIEAIFAAGATVTLHARLRSNA